MSDRLDSHIEWLRGDHESCNPWLADEIERLKEDRDALREALFLYGDRARMGPVLRRSMEMYGEQRPAKEAQE